MLDIPPACISVELVEGESARNSQGEKENKEKHTMKSEDTNRIVEKIVEALGKGEIPWRKPWRSCAAHNAISGSEYRGVNALVLNLASHYPDPRFLPINKPPHLARKSGREKRAGLLYSIPQ
jgi:hypothetical protein